MLKNFYCHILYGSYPGNGGTRFHAQIVPRQSFDRARSLCHTTSLTNSQADRWFCDSSLDTYWWHSEETLFCGELETNYKTQGNFLPTWFQRENFRMEIIRTRNQLHQQFLFLRCQMYISHKYPILFPSCAIPSCYLPCCSPGGSFQLLFHLFPACVVHITVVATCKWRSRIY